MSKQVAVFASDANHRVDQPRFHVSMAEAEIRVARHEYRRLHDRAIQEPESIDTPAHKEIIPNGFKSVWQQKPSAGFFVWQMRRKNRHAKSTKI